MFISSDDIKFVLKHNSSIKRRKKETLCIYRLLFKHSP